MRYIIGIDLGTTNSCVSFVDTESPKLAVEAFFIPQLSAPGFVEAQPVLPSFCYLTLPHEWVAGALDLPWKKQESVVVGKFAQTQGEKSPNRSIQSAKSWLCHSAANRRDRILPFEASEGIEKLSPVHATANYLKHIKEAWNHLMGKGRPENEFEAQEIILTVPASFDEVARSLTVESAKEAGYASMTLLEEPQAAFYCWIAAHEKKWEQLFKEGDTILICDVGGGTTDFSLIQVVTHNNQRTFQRMSVGDHLLLGGDNMDAALCHMLEQKLNKELNPQQRVQLSYQARHAKEQLLNPANTQSENYQCILQGTGSKVVQDSFHVNTSKKEIEECLLQGFFGVYPWNEAVNTKKGTPFRTMGLPYETEPSITKHLASFLLKAAKICGETKSPDYVLVNGGTMKPRLFQQAILDSLSLWFPGKTPQLLTSPSLDLAVSRGAAYYGKVRRGLGVKIYGGVPRSYYLALDTGDATPKALTLLTRGAEEGASYQPQETFWVSPNKPVAFHLYSSEVRLHDQQGELVEIAAEEMHRMPPIHTILRYGKGAGEQKIPVNLHMSLTSIGTLELWLQSQKTDHRWTLEFQVRASSGKEDRLLSVQEARTDETYDLNFLNQSKQVLEALFLEPRLNHPKGIIERLEGSLEKPRQEWAPSILRGLWETLVNYASKRKLTDELEKRWWNLAGYFLRPGFGYPLDDFRLKELWKIILEDSRKTTQSDDETHKWICYRRVAGGLSKGQQVQLANEILPTIWNKRTHEFIIKNKKDLYPYSEKVRMVASFELLDIPLKIKLGEALLKRMTAGQAESCDFWALGRIGARHLFHGSSANVIPREVCMAWIQTLLKLQPINRSICFVLVQLARQTDHQILNVPSEVIKQVEKILSEHAADLKHILLNEGGFTQQDQEMIFGEQLPLGLSLENT
ncbi:MAG: molecular chaperone DnaK [Parachlamydia sp.]|nr:MAG: molecular chaperone DnaK [Parachlamydia sp.]